MHVAMPTKTTARTNGKPSNGKPKSDKGRTGFRTMSVRSGRPRVKNVRKLPASYRDEIRRLLFGVRTAVGDWPDGELPALCDALHVLADDLAESVEAGGGDQ